MVVGSKPTGASAWGQVDLIGNLSEWVLDWYADYPASCTDCANLAPGTARVVRGGDWRQSSDDPLLRSRARDSYDPILRGGEFIGFRCARDL